MAVGTGYRQRHIAGAECDHDATTALVIGEQEIDTLAEAGVALAIGNDPEPGFQRTGNHGLARNAAFGAIDAAMDRHDPVSAIRRGLRGGGEEYDPLVGAQVGNLGGLRLAHGRRQWYAPDDRHQRNPCEAAHAQPAEAAERRRAAGLTAPDMAGC